MPRGPKATIQQVEDALRKAGGVQTLAVELLKEAGLPIHRNTIGVYLNKYPELRAAYDEIVERNLDIAEAGLLAAIRDKTHPSQMTAIIFFLKTKGRGRGYSQTVQIEHSIRRTFADAVADEERVIEYVPRH